MVLISMPDTIVGGTTLSASWGLSEGCTTSSETTLTLRIGPRLCILFFLFFGCKDQGTELHPLTPYEKWKAYRFQDYTIDQTRVCFCANAGQTMRVTVRSGVILSVMRLSDATPMSSEIAQLYLTVDSLFAVIQNPGADSIVATYNERYGYPAHLDINPQLHPVDGGVLYETSNLQVP